MTLAERFMALFAGLTRAYGVYDLKEPSLKDTGKVVGKAVTRQAPVTVELWESHLSGESRGIGIVPIRDDSTCMFGALDIDGNNSIYTGFDAPGVARRLAELNIPMAPCRTKSGGVHGYLFASEPVPASLMIEKLREIAEALGLPLVERPGVKPVEIFPKQSTFLGERGDTGSWINMPYWNAAETNRYGLGLDGGQLTADAYLDAAEALRQPRSFYEAPLKRAVAAPAPKTGLSGAQYFPDGPPCLQTLVEIGMPDGTKNNGLLNMALYLKRAFPDRWREMVKEYATLFTPSQGPDDIAATMKSAARHGYHYTCRRDPIAAVCDSAVCRMRKFGVGQDRKRETGDDGEVEEGAPPRFPVIGELRKLMTKPPVWFLDVDGKTIKLTNPQLQKPDQFQAQLMMDLNIMIPLPTQTSWQRMVASLFKNVVEMEAPADSSPDGQFWEHLEKFCLRSPGRAQDDILNGRPWTEDGFTWFRMFHLDKFLKQNQFKVMDPQQVTVVLRDRGCVHKKMSLRGKEHEVWGVPEFTKLEPKTPSEEGKTVF